MARKHVVSVKARFWWLDRSRVDGLCPECWLPGLMKLVYVLDIAGRVTVDERTACVECGSPQ